MPEREFREEEVRGRGGVGRTESETGVGEVGEDVVDVGDGGSIERDGDDVFGGTTDPESVEDGPGVGGGEGGLGGETEVEDGSVLGSVVVYDSMETYA